MERDKLKIENLLTEILRKDKQSKKNLRILENKKRMNETKQREYKDANIVKERKKNATEILIEK